MERRTFVKLYDKSGSLLQMAFGITGGQLRTLKRRLHKFRVHFKGQRDERDPTVQILTDAFFIANEAEKSVFVLFPELGTGHGPFTRAHARQLVELLKRDGLEPHHDSDKL
jgi:hypothetical protein